MGDTTVSFDGVGYVSVVPDQAVFNLTVSSKGKQGLVQTAADQASKKTSLLRLLVELGVELKNVASSGYQNEPETRYENHNNVETGWFICTETVTVKVAKELANKVVGRVGDFAKVNGVSYTVSRQLAATTKEAATELAIQAAEAKAKKREARLKMNLGKLVGYTEGQTDAPRVYAHRMMSLGAAESNSDDAAMTEGETEISASVVLTYNLQ